MDVTDKLSPEEQARQAADHKAKHELQKVDPDELYYHGDNVVTFGYLPSTGRLYTMPHPATHPDLPYYHDDIKQFLRAQGFQNHMRGDLMEAGVILGRSAVYEGRHIVGLWNAGLQQKPATVAAILRQLDVPPDTYVWLYLSGNRRDGGYIGTVHRADEFVTPTGAAQTPATSKPARPLFQVGSRRLTLPDVLSALHMVRGHDLDAIRAAVCAQANAVRPELSAQDAHLLDYAVKKLGCQSDILDRAKFGYRQQLRNLFRDPAALEKETGSLGQFRTQRDLDRAFDYLRGFKEWLQEGQIQGEYWIDESGTVDFADKDVGDRNHEGIAIDAVAAEYADQIDKLAKDLGVVGSTSRHGEVDMEALQTLLDELEQSLAEQGQQNPVEYIRQAIGADPPAMRILTGRGDARDYAMRHFGWIAVRSNNVELYNFAARRKALARGLGEILSNESMEDTPAEDIEFAVYDHATNRSFNATLADIEGQQARPQQMPTTTYNRPLPAPPQPAAPNKSVQTPWNQAAQQAGLATPGREYWRGTSEGRLV